MELQFAERRDFPWPGYFFLAAFLAGAFLAVDLTGFLLALFAAFLAGILVSPFSLNYCKANTRLDNLQ
jgi:fructose-specific phosphotransferase system IIC component